MNAEATRSQRGSRLLWAGVLFVLLLAAVIVYAGTRGRDGSSSTAAGDGAATQRIDGGNVTVEATWDGVSAGPIFAVALDTHAVDLDGVDLGALALLRVDGREVAPLGWDAPKGGHHRSGRLTFPATVDGTPTIGPGSTSVELIVRNVAGVPERVFRWMP